jgi:hypothetical protein
VKIITKNSPSWPLIALTTIACLLLFGIVSMLWAQSESKNSKDGPHPTAGQPPVALGKSQDDAAEKSHGCKSCHTSTDNETMHPTGTVVLGCASCHGGNAEIVRPPEIMPGTTPYDDLEEQAHAVVPRSELHLSRNPERAYTKWMRRSKQYVQFVNPGDLRVADQTCGGSGCHTEEVHRVRTSMMTHGAMLWAAALYNNGAFPYKDAHFGQSYSPEGVPQDLMTWPPPAPEVTRKKGILPRLVPLERWEVSQPGNVLRVFERGGGQRSEVGNPQDEDTPGRPDAKLSDRGFGTLLRTDPVFLGLQKTRLFDPLLSFPGTNDHPGDYRGSGCTGCHVIYANDRDREHSSFYSAFGNQGHSFQDDPTIRKDEPGHPIQHVFTKIIPSSQCMVCHIHPGTNMVASYFGYTWWDNEVDGDKMYPKDAETGALIQKNPSQVEYHDAHEKNPEGSAAKGLWWRDNFLENLGTEEFNGQLEKTQFGDFHSHGWVFRKVFKQDRYGSLLDEEDKPISSDDRRKFEKAVQLKDIHLEKGMHCTDCHFNQDVHGNGNLYGETRNAIEISCTDCHGTIQSYTTLATSGPAAPDGGTKMQTMRTPWKELRFYWKNERLFQRSSVEHGREWEVVQVKDVINPDNKEHYNPRARAAKLLGKDGVPVSAIPANPEDDTQVLAHPMKEMTCVSCHSSWTTTCFGCHLPMTANLKMPMLQNEGTMTRNWTEYDFQVLRNDMYMLGKDGTVTGNKVAPIRSACAVVVSSQNQNRDWIYYGQQTVSAEGLSGTAFSPYVPHTVRAKETRGCTDCHVSKENDNNAWMAQLLLQGTNFLNYLGRFAYVANGNKGFSAIAFAERQEPEAVIGSDFHQIAYPDNYKRHQERHQDLKEAYEHRGKEVLDVQLRGEYLYAAMGKAGLRIYDVANIENKDFSERIITAPVSPLGQRFYVRTRYATAVAAPSTAAIDPARKQFPENEEQKIHPIYSYLYVADKLDGLVVVGNRSGDALGVSTLLDGEPRNNFLKVARKFNPPGGPLDGARRITIAGIYAYILCKAGLVVVNLDDPLDPKITATIAFDDARGLAIQFRYAFVVDRDGLKILDVTDLASPRLVQDATLKDSRLADARNITVSRTYAYIAAGKQGMAIVNIEKPEHPVLDRMFGGGQLTDTNDIKIGMVSSSQFALVADGVAGFKVVQLFSPQRVPGFYGFSPQPDPQLIAKFPTRGPALAVSRGVDRDRAVDESGNQLSVFGRRGSRPFNLKEMQQLFLCSAAMADRKLCRQGDVYTVTDDPSRPIGNGSSATVSHIRRP